MDDYLEEEESNSHTLNDEEIFEPRIKPSSSTTTTEPQRPSGLRTRIGSVFRRAGKRDDNSSGRMQQPSGIGEPGDSESPRTYSPPDASSMFETVRRQNFLVRKRRQLLAMVKKHPARLLYWTGGAIITALFLVFLFMGDTPRRLISPQSDGSEGGGEPVDEALVRQGHGHLQEHVERLEYVGEWTPDQRQSIRLKRFGSGREYSEDPVVGASCQSIFPPEIEAGLLQVGGQKPSRGYDHVVVRMEDILRAQESLLERMAADVAAETGDGGPPSPVIVAPKAWQTQLIHGGFNPCLLSMRTENGMIVHMANPVISNDILRSMDSARVDPTEFDVDLEWSAADFFADPFPPMRARLFREVHVHSHNPATGEKAYNVFRADLAYAAQFWIHALYNSDRWKEMVTGEKLPIAPQQQRA